MSTRDDGARVGLRGLDRAALHDLVVELGAQPYRARQLLGWLHRHDVQDFDEMRNLPASLRRDLALRGHLRAAELDMQQESRDGSVKLRWRLHDGLQIESVFIPDAATEGRHALCVSTQAGCAMGCTFCATASLKLRRHLYAHEIVDQLRGARRWLARRRPDERIGSLVLMGMGEPLHNYEATVAALRLFVDDQAYDLSSRRVTVSTVGVVPALRRLLDDVDVQIAVSLVTVDNALRSRLMPINRKHPVDELLAACAELPLRGRRRITFEVVLLAGINDSPEQARAMAKKLRRLACKVNLIPFNPHPLSEFEAPPMERVLAFQKALVDGGVGAYLRQPRGQDIDAACGMLAAKATT